MHSEKLKISSSMNDHANTSYSAALNQAIMRMQPAFFSWPTEQQDRYRLNLPDKDSALLDRLLLKSLFGIDVHSKDEQEEVFNNFSDEDHLTYNSTILPFTGIGENSFYLNESLGDKTLLDFETLYDYDYDDFKFQEKFREEDIEGYQKRPYYGSLYYSWARLNKDGKFYYATLSNLAGYLVGQIEDAAFDKVEELIPHSFAEGKDHGKAQEGGFLHDMRIEAGGREGQLDLLNDRYYQYSLDRSQALAEYYHQKNLKQVFILDNSQSSDPHLDFIFSDVEALKAVRLKRFIRDCEALKGNSEELAALIAVEKKKILSFIQESYEDIMANYDPKIVKLKKKRQIIISDQAAKDLL